MHCTNWPSTSNHKCNDDGDSLILLDSSINDVFECEALCLENDPGEGCCYLSTVDGCFWKGGATVETTTDYNNSFAVNCTYESPGKFALKYLMLVFLYIIRFDVLLQNSSNELFLFRST